jgi:predicted lipid-binding transport protein (Tim44 family)
MQNPQPLLALRLTAQACLLALTLSAAGLSYANSGPSAPLSASEVAKARKAMLRAQAEHRRTQREAQEVARDRAQLGEVTSPPASATRFSALHSALAAVTPGLSSQRLATEAQLYIHTAASRLGLGPKASAGTAGFMVGMGGSWAYSRLMATASADTAALSGMTLAVADVGVAYLEDRYSFALHTGRAVRYSLVALLACGLFFAACKALSRKPGQVSRRTSSRASQASYTSNKLSNSGTGMLNLFRRKSATSAAKHEPASAVVVAFDMDTLRDYAFNLLFARGRHDLAGVGDMLTPGFARCLQSHFQALEAKGHWNKVERVCGVACTEVESWQEGDTSFAKLNVSWKALDYVVNYNRRPGELGYVVEGDANKMELFAEEWVVTRRAGGSWLVDAMYPAAKKSPLVR